MAVSRVITKKEMKAEKRSRFRLVCKGLSKEEFSGVYTTFKNHFGCKVVLRNPFPPEFDPKAVHEIIAHVTGNVVGMYATKKVIDAAKELFVAYMKFKFMSSSKDGQPRQVALYSADGKLFEYKDKRKAPKKRN
jgi:hypothetical protein